MSLTMSFSRLVVFVVTIISILVGTRAKPPSRVVGGADGELGEFPYMAGIIKKNEIVCGGAIIGKRHILTAAHCIVPAPQNPAKVMSIVTGTNAPSTGAGKSHEIQWVKIHPEYSNNSNDSWRNDIAVIAFTQPINFPENDTPGKTKCVASGWGGMSYPKGYLPVNIRKTSMTTMSNADCEAQANGQYQIFETNLCAFEAPGIGLCVGDSGGPLVCNGTTVVAVTSFVVLCAKGVPDVFTRVYPYVDFIRQTMAKPLV